MVNLIVELSKYLIIILTALYTLFSFTVFRSQDKKKQKHNFYRQCLLILLFQLSGYIVLYLDSWDIRYLLFYLLQLVFFFAVLIVYQKVYKNLSRLVLNHMLFLLSVGFLIQIRLDFDSGIRQFIMTCAAMGICLIVPFIIDRFSYIPRLGGIYAAAGIILLLSVLVFGEEKYGARNWISIGGIMLQPSEFVKILYVFFMASLLAKWTDFKHVVIITIIAAMHVGILVLEKDLGGALIFFITYVFVLFVAANQPLYLFLGFGAGAGAAFVSYRLFSHVRVRVSAWKNPWMDIDNTGYQVTQSLFAIGTGGWFGLGLGRGLPESIPVVDSDFIFAALSEEMGGIFCLFIIMIYISTFLMFINIAIKMKNNFYRLTALGLSIIFMFQVFLSIGGVVKFIPSTGVTLPLISSGGSSVLSTCILFSIIQGLYVKEQRRPAKNGEE